MSSTTMPENAPIGCAGIVASAAHAATANTTCVSQNDTCRRESERKRSPSSTTLAPHSSTISGRMVEKSMFIVIAGLDLALRDVDEQVGDRVVHHVDERLRPQPHP